MAQQILTSTAAAKTNRPPCRLASKKGQQGGSAKKNIMLVACHATEEPTEKKTETEPSGRKGLDTSRKGRAAGCILWLSETT
tara:strand:+ start:980 stop:1225 length:246 start_codon:yes stop_codon:yes gene_type:complete